MNLGDPQESSDDCLDDIADEEPEGEQGNGDSSQYFHVSEAEPPKNYDDPYSSLPPKVESRLE